MKSPRKNKRKTLDETSSGTVVASLSAVSPSLSENALNGKILRKKLKAAAASVSSSKSSSHLLELTLNEPLVTAAANSSFAISPSSMSPSSSSTYSTSSNVNNKQTSKTSCPNDE